MNLLQKAFSIKNTPDKKHKIITVLGIKLQFQRKLQILLSEMKQNKISTIRSVQRLITASVVNQRAFSEFKNIHNGQSVVLIGAGPTVNYFEPIRDAIYVGCNRAFLRDDINFNYLF